MYLSSLLNSYSLVQREVLGTLLYFCLYTPPIAMISILFSFEYKIFTAFSLKYSVCIHTSLQERWSYQDCRYGLLHRKNKACMSLHFKRGK